MTRRRTSATPARKAPPNRRASRPRGQRTRNHLLEVKVRSSTAKRARNRRITDFVVRLVLVVAICTASYFGFLAITDKFFLTNPEYNLTHVNADTDGLMSDEEVMEITGIDLGTNIFKIDIGEAEKQLRAIDHIENVRIERLWPDTLNISATKRIPAAWLARVNSDAFSADNALLVDATGHTIRPYRIESDYWHLPVIKCTDPAQVVARDPLAIADLEAALDLIAVNDQIEDSLLKIRSLDISHGYSIEVTNEANAQITFAPKHPIAQLERLQRLLEHCDQTGRELESVNLIPTKYTPVRFVMAANATPTPEVSER
ncbi:MAG: FtsQ-type POTRA domain-containing protein [Chthoniobacterales bacterium]